MRSPLLNRGRLLNNAASVLVHISGGEDLRLFEVQTLMRELATTWMKSQASFRHGHRPGAKNSLSVTIFSPLASDDGSSEDLAPTTATTDEPAAPEPAAPTEPALFADTDFELPEIPGIESSTETADPAEYLPDETPEPASPSSSRLPLPSNWADAVTPPEPESPYP